MCDDVTVSRDVADGQTLVADDTNDPFDIQDDKSTPPTDSLMASTQSHILSKLSSTTTMKMMNSSERLHVQALPMDTDDEIDVHTCASCKVLFTSLEDYLGHKIGSAKCGKNLNSKKKQLMKQLVAAPSGRGRKRGRPPLAGRVRQEHNPSKQGVAKQVPSVKGGHEDGKYDRLKLHHKQSDIISDHSGYKCQLCGRSFRRQAALNRHSQFDHREKGSEESEGDDGDDSTDYKNDVAETQNEFAVEQMECASPSTDLSHEVLNICVASNTVVTSVSKSSPSPDSSRQYVTVMEETEPGSGIMKETYKMQLDDTDYLIVPQTLNVEQAPSVKLKDEPLNHVTCNDIEDSKSELCLDDINQQDHRGVTDHTEQTEEIKCRETQAVESEQLLEEQPESNDDCEPPEILVTTRKRIQPEPPRVGAIQCVKCCQFFKDRFVLRAHMLTHSTVKSYHCSFVGCSYSSKTKGSLTRHARRHTGERPFKCKLCGRAFRESGCLARHLKARGLCSARSDSEFPRYKKNLQFNSAKSLPHSNDGSEPASNKEQCQTEFISFVRKSSAQSIGPLVQNAENSVTDVISGLKTEEVVLIPVSSSRAAAIEDIADNNVYVDMAESDDIAQAVPATRSKPPESVLLTVVSEEDLQAHQGLSLEIAADTCDEDPYIVDMGKFDGETSYEMTDRPSTSPDATILMADEISSMDSNKVSVVKGEKESMENTSDQPTDHSQSLTCVVDQQKFDSKEALVQHLKTHMIMCKFRCDRCSYMTDDQVKMEDHIQITHLKQWIAKDTTLLTGEPEEPPVDEISKQVTIVLPSTAADLSPTSYNILSAPTAVSGTKRKTPDQKSITDRRKPVASKKQGTYYSVREAHLAVVQLQLLMGQKEGADPANAVCPVCYRTFKAAATLKQHILSHTGDKQHRCVMCEKTFYTKDALNKHMIAHSLERNYKCGECGKLFKRISHVREHLKVHSNERPYPCRICFRLFKSVNACKVHMRIHSDQREQVCPNCHKLFREKGALDRHIRTHTGEKPYACQHCNRTFAEQGTLNRHLKAKVPCTKELFDLRASQKTSADTTNFPGKAATVIDDHELASTIHMDTPSEDMKSVRIDNSMADNAKFVPIDMEQPTVKTEEENVLTEFSSVVDTQEYIVEEHRQMDDDYTAVSGAHLVQLLPSQAVTTQGDISTSSTDTAHLQTLLPQEATENIQYIYMDNVDSENIIFIDENTGEQLELVTPSQPETGITGESLDLVTPCDGEITGTEQIMDLSESVHGAVDSTLHIEAGNTVTVDTEGLSEEAFREELLAENIVIQPNMEMEVSVSGDRT